MGILKQITEAVAAERRFTVGIAMEAFADPMTRTYRDPADVLTWCPRCKRVTLGSDVTFTVSLGKAEDERSKASCPYAHAWGPHEGVHAVLVKDVTTPERLAAYKLGGAAAVEAMLVADGVV